MEDVVIIDGVICSPEGLRLLEQNPDFFDSVWKPSEKRETTYNIIAGPDDIKYFEKIPNFPRGEINLGVSEFFRILCASDKLSWDGFKKVRSVKPYFATSTRVFMEHIKKTNVDRSNWEKLLSPQDEGKYWQFSRESYHHELGVSSSGDPVIYDMHIPITSRYEQMESLDLSLIR